MKSGSGVTQGICLASIVCSVDHLKVTCISHGSVASNQSTNHLKALLGTQPRAASAEVIIGYMGEKVTVG